MSGDLVPDPELRLSNADRERVVEQLNQAVAEGRLTLVEFEERLDGVLAARTTSDLSPFLAGLPAMAQAASTQVLELRARSSKTGRMGRWLVPRVVKVHSQSSSVRLDMREAAFSGSTVHVELEVRSSSVLVVLPAGASADASDIAMVSSTTKIRVPGAGSPHVVITGQMQSSTLRVRYQKKFLRWRW